MPTAEILRDRRDRARERQERVQELSRGAKLTLIELGQELVAEREEIDHLQLRRKALRAALEEEIQRDEEGKGKKGQGWEQWAEARRDELADLIEGCAARIDRLILTQADTREARRELAKRDRRLAKRIEVIERKIERKADRSGQLTPHFHIAEFDCRDGTPCPRQSYDAARAWCVNYGEPLREEFGPVHFNSAYRHAAYNRAVGGASLSIHVYDASYQHNPFAVAVDHWVEGASPSAVQAWHESHTDPDGMGRYASFTHVDSRNRIGWPDSRWIGP